MNRITISGTVENTPVFSHEVHNEQFYAFEIRTKRKSETCDIIPCIIPEVLIGNISAGDKITIIGEIRTRNITADEAKKALEISVFVRYVDEYVGHDDELVEISGYVCKEPIYRETPLGREITDVLIASNRERCFKSDYIPCIAWGRNAVRMASSNIGDKVVAKGRLQSRVYTKRLDNEGIVERTAYELSLNYIRMEDNADEHKN